ncbi:hypothetical protein BCT08_20115 [Vibrio splendidus]|nr:hypothetical protein BCU89_09415 [Vibrio splendidus]PMO52887.1 hypothetical protein BCT08_20115 [Vibrio splendidus]
MKRKAGKNKPYFRANPLITALQDVFSFHLGGVNDPAYIAIELQIAQIMKNQTGFLLRELSGNLQCIDGITRHPIDFGNVNNVPFPRKAQQLV